MIGLSLYWMVDITEDSLPPSGQSVCLISDVGATSTHCDSNGCSASGVICFLNSIVTDIYVVLKETAC